MVSAPRRKFLAAAMATAASKSVVSQILPNARPHVVVIGGGAGGARVAGLLARNSNHAVDVTLVEANRIYQSCFFSNLYLGAMRSYNSLSHDYDFLRYFHGVNVLFDRAVNIDRVAQKVELEKSTLQYDALVLAPGIDFTEGAVNGWRISDQERMPHAYKGGEQIRLLRKQIETMPQGGVFALVAPSGEYRCPPGPYERVCMVAHLLKRTNPTAKIIVVDPKPEFPSLPLFRTAWKKYYAGMIELHSKIDMAQFRVDPKHMTMTLNGERVKVDVCNVIPNQKAGKIAELAGVLENNWAPVHAEDMRSTIDGSIYIIGDSAAQGDMPKSAFSANSQAKVCANAILHRLTGSRLYPPRYFHTCWSLLAQDDGVKMGASYKAVDGKITLIDNFASGHDDDASQRKRNYTESLDWYVSITNEMFAKNV